ncbi:MAG: Glu/Leu/Phe/Val dehydrogenase dimerization domain-containing protein [Gemmatimonadota bacterium]
MLELDSRPTEQIWERCARFFGAAPQIVLEWSDPESEARGWLVINSLRGGAAGGGTRMRPGASRAEATFLAKAMELKFAIAGPPIGGAKSGIDFDPEDPRKPEVLGRWFQAILPELATRYGTAGDLNVNELREVMPHCEALGIGHPQLGVLRGHLGLDGAALGERVALMHEGLDQVVEGEFGVPGTDLRVFDLVTGYGVAASLARLLEHQEREPEDTRVLLQGFGCVGGAAAFYLARLGVRLVGIVDSESAVIDRSGFSSEDLEIFLSEREGNRLPEPRKSARGTHDEFWSTPADVFVAAAGSGTLDAESLGVLDTLGVQTVVCAANQPFAASEPGDVALEREADERFAVLADIIAGSGTAHAFACQSRSDCPLTPDAVFWSIQRTVSEAVDESVRRAGSATTGLLAGALDLALERCGEAGPEELPDLS